MPRTSSIGPPSQLDTVTPSRPGTHPSGDGPLNQSSRGVEQWPDLRMPMIGVIAWLAALAGLALPPRQLTVTVALTSVTCGWLWLRYARRVLSPTTMLTWLLVLIAVAGVASIRHDVAAIDPIKQLAPTQPVINATIWLSSDPMVRSGQYGPYVVIHGYLRSTEVRGRHYRHTARVLLIGTSHWAEYQLGSLIKFRGRLQPVDDGQLAAIVTASGEPELLRAPNRIFLAGEKIRQGIRDAVATQPPGPRALIPALVDGDDAELDPAIEENFQTSGLTHLVAVSGTNLTLIVGFLLIIARWCGVRGRAMILVGFVGVAGFILVARTEPSVLRAAVMGSVALLGMSHGGTRKGARILGVAVLGLMLAYPWLAPTAGFSLSVLATAGIIVVAPALRDGLSTWMPLWLAEAIAVPLAAQLACTPVVAAISDQVSLVAVLANLLAAPVVGPATVLGLSGGIVAVIAPPLGQLIALPAGWSARWIIAVAEKSANVRLAAFEVTPTWWVLALLTVTCVALAVLLPILLQQRGLSLLLAALVAAVWLLPFPALTAPAHGWMVVACDVGQGDGLVVNAGPASAIVIDVGPDPARMDRCLRKLGVSHIELLVVTHFHADHAAGIAGVVRGRTVAKALVSPLPEPPVGVAQVKAALSQIGVPMTPGQPGMRGSAGPARWQVLAPRGPVPPSSTSPPNDASVVLLVEIDGVRILFLGDQEEPAQRRLARDYPQLRVDILKVAHHGSRKQHGPLMAGLGAQIALISAGADNDYGHPSPTVLNQLDRLGVTVYRTDTDGRILVRRNRSGALEVITES